VTTPAPYQIKQNDTRPVYAVQLLDRFGTPTQTPLDLTNATRVKFKMRKSGTSGVPKVDVDMTITDRTTGKCEHVWAPTDLDTVGSYDVEFEITWADAGVETVPNAGYLTVKVVDDLDA
jgi:hypothetical protein